MLFCFCLLISSLLILDVQTEVNEGHDLENDNFDLPGELHDVNRRDANKQYKRIEPKKRKPRKNTRKNSRQSVVFEGEHCQFIDFANVRSSGFECINGAKMVVKNKAGNRKQFLIADSRTIYGFVRSGGSKFATDCTSYTDKTCDIRCKAVTGLNSITLARSVQKKIPAGARVYSGANCEWIDLNKVLSDGVGCNNGYKFVIKPQSGNRRQLLLVEGKTILAFVTRGSKFTDCRDFTEVTSEVLCKAVASLETVSLPSACSTPGVTADTVGLLITGGFGGSGTSGGSGVLTSVEVWVPSTGQHCRVTDLPGWRTQHSQEAKTVCGGIGSDSWASCLTLNAEGSWDETTRTLVENRYYHVSWAYRGGTILMGGESSPRTSEKIDLSGISSSSFDLDYDTAYACAINLDSSVILTGGYVSLTTVTEYNEFGWLRDLPDLNQGRVDHGCSHWVDGIGRKHYIVAGGHFPTSPTGPTGYDLSSTEVMDESGSVWTLLSGELPSPRTSVRIANIGSRLFMAGGLGGTVLDEILEFDPITGEWSQADRMLQKRSGHDVSVITNFESFC